MKIYQLCEFLKTDTISIVRGDQLLIHIEGVDAVNAVATIYEHETIEKIIPTKYGIEITIE